MNSYSLTHLADSTLLHDLVALVTQDRATTAALLAHLAEVDERRLYLPLAFSSMYDYCVRELHMSEDTAFKRIRVARTARRFPAIFPALADGRLNLNAVLLLTPNLTPETRSEEHTSELQSLTNLVCRLLLEKKKKKKHTTMNTHEPNKKD